MEIINNRNVFRVTKFYDYFLQYYNLFGDNEYPTDITIDGFLEDYIKSFYKKIKLKLPKIIQKDAYKSYNIVKDNNNKILIGFSGGKDGVAVALLAKEQGLEPVLYHLYGINRTYKGEIENARKLAKAMNMQLIVHKIEIKGKQKYPDHPFKNQLIMSKMVDTGLELEIKNYAIGNHEFETESDANIKYEFSDSQEQIMRFDGFIKKYFASFHRKTWLKNNEHALRIIFDYNPDLLNMISSCVMPKFRRPRLRRFVKDNYGENVLLDGRCGCYCYKCAKEYLLLSEWGFLPENKEFKVKCKTYLDKSDVHYE